MFAHRVALRRIVCVVTFFVCLGVMGFARDAAAQPRQTLGKAESRDLAKACGRTGRFSDCVSAIKSQLKGGLGSIADLLLAELQAAPLPTEPAPTPSAAPKSSSSVVWDGTFAHPNAPSFYMLKGYVRLDTRTSADACAQLPDNLRSDRQLLLKLTCQAQRELAAAGGSRWPDETAEFQTLRALLVSCLPSDAARPDPCAAPSSVVPNLN
jgi:hypothetical protein